MGYFSRLRNPFGLFIYSLFLLIYYLYIYIWLDQ